MANVIDKVVQRGLCSGCGVCAGVCPSQALQMITYKNGDLAPSQVGECSQKCNLCLHLCPFSNGSYMPSNINKDIYQSHATTEILYHEKLGYYLTSYAGYHGAENRRLRSASGGLTTWCLEKLLQKSMVDKVALVRRSSFSRPNYFEFYETDDISALLFSVGSVYHPVEISSVVQQIIKQPDVRWAVVGVPCLCAGLRRSKRLSNSIRYIFGLACGMYQNTMYTEMLLAYSGINRNQVGEIQYRNKRQKGRADNYSFFAKGINGKKGKSIAYHGLPYFLGKNAFFRLNACNYCGDVFASFADACFMDAWLPQYVGEPRGTSLVLVRNQSIAEILMQGCLSGELHLEPVSPEEICQSQKGHIRRKQELLYWRINKSMPDNLQTPSLFEKYQWWIQKRCQTRSKWVWAKIGRKMGTIWFWIFIADIILIKIVVMGFYRVKRCFIEQTNR